MEAKQMDNRAIIYVRVSSEEQAKGYSPDAQLRLLRDYAEKNGLEVVHEYNESQSATYQGRSDFARMVEAIKKESIPNVLFEKADRMSRNPIDANVIYDLIENRGLKVFLVKSGTVINRSSSPPTKFSGSS
jgi:site-specific DNA recombinase